MSDSPLVYVVILTYNHCKDTLEALGSLYRMTYPNFHVLMIDNQSSDQSVDVVRASYTEVEILVHPYNRGFAAGVNPGLQLALERGAEYVLLINNDVLVDPAMLTHLVSAMEPDVGAAAPMIYYLDDPTRIWSSGFSKHPLLLEMRGGARDQVDRGQWRTVFDVDYVLGCAVLLNGAMLRTSSLFDERYFFYYEDIDYSLQIKRLGYRLITVPSAKMWHRGAGSAGMRSAFRVYQMARGSVIFFRTHARGWQWPAIFFFRLGSALKTSLGFLFDRQFHLVYHYWRGIWNGWREGW